VNRDPYRLVEQAVRELAAAGGLPYPVTSRQMRQAAVCATALIAALGGRPAVDGEATHPTVLAGLDLLTRMPAHRPEPAEGGGSR